MAPREFNEQMRLARQGCSQALGELLESYRTYLLLVARDALDPRLRRKMEASDVVQNVFLRARRQFADFRGGSERQWRGWIRQILIRDIQDVRRRYWEAGKRDVGREVPWDTAPGDVAGAVGVGETADGRVPRTQQTPMTVAIAREEAALVRQAMAELSEEYQRVIEMRHWRRLTFDQIGRQTGRSAGAARKLWSRALVRLQQRIRCRV